MSEGRIDKPESGHGLTWRILHGASIIGGLTLMVKMVALVKETQVAAYFGTGDAVEAPSSPLEPYGPALPEERIGPFLLAYRRLGPVSRIYLGFLWQCKQLLTNTTQQRSSIAPGKIVTTDRAGKKGIAAKYHPGPGTVKTHSARRVAWRGQHL